MKKIKDAVHSIFIPTLSKKLTLYFVIFGIIMGYVAFILYTIVNTGNYINVARSTLIPLFQEVIGSGDEDFIIDLIGKKNDEIGRLYNIFEKYPVADLGLIMPELFYQDAETGDWKRVYVDKSRIFREKAADPGRIDLLNQTLRRRMYHSRGIFFGRRDRVTIAVMLPLHKARNKYVMKLEMNRQGLVDVMRSNAHRFVFFCMLLCVISALLGKFFAGRIARPIKSLSTIASQRAAGDMSVEFRVNRRDEIGILSDSLNIMTSRIDSHVSEIQRRMKTMETMNKIDKAVLSSISRADLLDRVVEIVSSLFHSDSIALALYNKDKGGFDILSLYQKASRGILQEKPFVAAKNLHPGHAESPGTLCQFSYSRDDSSGSDVYRGLVSGNVGKIINVPIHMSGVFLGALVIAKDTDKDFSAEEIESISMLADQVGVALQSVKAFEEKERLLLGILLALTRSIDAKSKWTAGHSERVARYSEEIAIRMNLPAEDIRTITFSAILHDIGKIAVSESILDKPGKLTNDEYSIIKTHPGVGAGIIADIPSYESIVPGILYHHEHWNGSGYPEGLASEKIPLNSRIITVADVYDAITSSRPYRDGMEKDKAMEFLLLNSREIFDPGLVEIFMNILSEERG